ncbi:hypothetical protein DFQ28_010100 [Apophysomyces sp. BC1034]|nr:hypothetical protein DFQ28_010100 [Apophysomyces sp. BC1034]
MQLKDSSFDGPQIIDHPRAFYQNHSPHLSDLELNNASPFTSRSSPLCRQQDFYDDRSIESGSVTFPVNMKRSYLDLHHHQQQHNNPDLLFYPPQPAGTALLDFRYKPAVGSAPANIGYSHMQQSSFGEHGPDDERAAPAIPNKHSTQIGKAEIIENYEDDFAAQAK